MPILGLGNTIFWGGSGAIAPPATPCGLTAQTLSTTECFIFWDEQMEIDGFSIERSTDGISYAEIDTTDSDADCYKDTTCVEATKYYYRIRAYVGSNYSEYSDVASTVTHNSKMVAGWKFDEIRDALAFNQSLADEPFHEYTYSSAAYYNGKTYISYNGYYDRPYIIAYTHATNTWSDPVEISTNALGVTDDHGMPAILIDNAGYIHCIFGAHNSAFYYSKSDNPEDITAWTPQASPANGTYPQLIQLSDNTIYLFYRSATAPDDDWGYITSADGGSSWSAFTKVSEDYAYCLYRKGTGDIIHCCMHGDQTTSLARENIYYMYFNGTNWKNIAGTNLSLPLTLADSASIIAYDSGNYYIANKCIDFDASNNPFILFSESTVPTGMTDYNMKILRRSGGSWVVDSLGIGGELMCIYLSALDVQDSNNLDAYISQEDSCAVNWDLEKWTSSDAGVTWTKESTIKRGAKYNWVVKIRDCHVNAKILFSEYQAYDYNAINRGYLYGDGGIVNNANCAYPSYAKEIKNIIALFGYNSGVAIAGGVYNNCYQFAGDDTILIPDDDLLSFTAGTPDSPFSTSFWLKVSGTADTQHLLNKGRASHREWEVTLASNVIRFMIMHEAGTTYQNVSAAFTTVNTWVHIMCTYDGSGTTAGLKIYFDNVLQSLTPGTAGTYTGMVNTTSMLHIGCYNNDRYYLVGYMDEPRVFNVELSEAERLKVYSNADGW